MDMAREDITSEKGLWGKATKEISTGTTLILR